MLTHGHDDGSITVLITGYAAIAVLLVVVGIDVSKLFLAQRAMSSAADGAALAADQAVAVHHIYSAGVRCGHPVPLNQIDAQRDAEQAVNDRRADLRHVFTSVGRPVVSVRSATVTVRLSGVVTVPFGRAIGWLLPGHADGQFRVIETSRATSPVAGTGC